MGRVTNEKQLQAKIFIDFSNQRPHERGLLWSTRNTTFSVRDGQTQVAMGMIKGVSDLIYFKNGIFTGIEIKLPGAEHDKNHIIQQYEWGKKITAEGGRYFIATNLEQFWRAINNKPLPTDYTLENISKIIKDSKSKIIFY